MARRLAMIAACLAALLVAPLFADARALQQTSTTCEAASSVSLVITSGSGSARSNAFCEAEADARSDIEKVVKDWVDDVLDNSKDGCTDLAASAVVDGWAEALAKAFASVTNEVDIQGTGTACAEGFAQGDAFALAIVEITVDVTLKAIQEGFGKAISTKVKNAIDKGVNTASGQAVGVALGGAISEVWASASDRVCTSDGQKKGFDEAEAIQIKQAEAFLFAEVILTVCSELDVDLKNLKEWQGSLADSTSFVAGNVENVVVEDTATEGASTGSSALPECDGQKKAVCCATSTKAQSMCTCGSGCAMQEVELSAVPASAAKVWQDTSSGEFCFCT